MKIDPVGARPMVLARARSLRDKLKLVAAREGVSLNAYVANVLAEQAGRAA